LSEDRGGDRVRVQVLVAFVRQLAGQLDHLGRRPHDQERHLDRLLPSRVHVLA